MNAAQLCFLCECIEKTRDVPGTIVEIGCSHGATAIFINKYMESLGIEKKYICIDTFSGFVAEDIKYEVSKRGKKKSFYYGFKANKKKWFDFTMKMNNINNVQSIQVDVNKLDFSRLGNISFCLLDVDLYRPIKKCLPYLFNSLSKNGIIIIDDCTPNDIRFDGADEAYKEFLKEINYTENIVLGKLGVIEKLI